jgi:hypothetical protein
VEADSLAEMTERKAAAKAKATVAAQSDPSLRSG